jgi:hypothetical protein
MLQLDNWQKDFLATKGDKMLCSGRQVGKTEVCARDCIEWIKETTKKGIVLMTAPQEFQAETLFNKTLNYLLATYPKLIKKGKNSVTKSKIELVKGITILCKTAGSTGFGLRSITVIRRYVDECSQMPECAWEAIDPQDLTTGADTIYLSTPFGMQGRFYDAWINKNHAYDSFARFSIDSKKCMEERQISEGWTIEQRDKSLKKIEQARARLTHKQFMQEYMGEFIESLMQMFPDKLIKACQTLHRETGQPLEPYSIKCRYYLGVDVGGRGGSETTFEVFKKTENNHFIQIDNINVNYEMITMTEREILHLDSLYHFRKVYIDSGGIGAGVYDHLLEVDSIKRRVEPIDNSKRALSPFIERKEKQDSERNEPDPANRSKLMKEDLYNNCLYMMERGEVEFLDDSDIFQSLKSVQFEITEKKDIIIFGEYTHIAEGIIRALWGVKDKSLNIWVK